MKEDKEKLEWSFKEAQILLHSNFRDSTLQKQVTFMCNRLHKFRILEGHGLSLAK
jgi:hypothetical protein